MPAKHVRVTQDGQLFRGPMVYYGGYLRASSGGTADVNVYDGQDATDAFLDGFRAPASEHDMHQIDLGLLVLRGLFIDAGANVEHFLVYYDDDVPEDTFGPTGVT